jgi:8-oxo-dGTP diphosphatase
VERVGVVGAALVRDGRVLASRRTEPPRLAGLWEFPGGKVEADETDVQALVRELREELRVEVDVGDRLGEVPIGATAELRVYLCRLRSGEPALVDHDQHRWLARTSCSRSPGSPSTCRSWSGCARCWAEAGGRTRPPVRWEGRQSPLGRALAPAEAPRRRSSEHRCAHLLRPRPAA